MGIDITDIHMVGTGEFEAACAIAAVDAELDGDFALAEIIRHDAAEAIMLHEEGLL